MRNAFTQTLSVFRALRRARLKPTGSTVRNAGLMGMGAAPARQQAFARVHGGDHAKKSA